VYCAVTRAGHDKGLIIHAYTDDRRDAVWLMKGIAENIRGCSLVLLDRPPSFHDVEQNDRSCVGLIISRTLQG